MDILDPFHMAHEQLKYLVILVNYFTMQIEIEVSKMF